MVEKMIGYARSADTNDRDSQMARLNAAGCSVVFTDRGAGGSLFAAPGWKQALKTLGPGDTLAVCTINALSPKSAALYRRVDTLMGKAVELTALDEPEAVLAVQSRLNYAPLPSPRTPVLYALAQCGQVLRRHARLSLLQRAAKPIH